MLIGHGHLVEAAQETEAAVSQVEPGTAWETEGVAAGIDEGATWREALSARLRPRENQVSAEDIFAILNGDEDAMAELCVARGVTVPMYCVWKSKYRQLDLDQLRKARRLEQRRRNSVIGLVLLTAVLLTGGSAVSIVWAVSATFKGLDESTLAIPAGEPGYRQSPSSGSDDPRPVPARAREVANADSLPLSGAAATIAETGYRIQVRAADSAGEGRAAVARLASKGYPAYMTRAVVGNTDVFRVRVGPFDTFAKAEAIASQLRSDGYSGVWIAR